MCRSCCSYWDLRWTFAKRNFTLNSTGFGGCLVTSSINARWRWVLTPFHSRVVGFERGSGPNLWVYKRKFGSIGESPSYQRAAVNSPVALRQLNEKKERRKKRRIWVVEGDYIVLIVSNSISICLVFISNLVQGVECCKQDFVNWWTENASYLRKQQREAERPFSSVKM